MFLFLDGDRMSGAAPFQCVQSCTSRHERFCSGACGGLRGVTDLHGIFIDEFSPVLPCVVGEKLYQFGIVFH